jgi:hypothetical protein
MKAASYALVLSALVACGGGAPPANAPSGGVMASQPASKPDDPQRPLSRAECQSLGEWMADECASRPNERSAHVEGWCTDIQRGVADGTWVAGDCTKNIRYMDSVCMRSAANVHTMMDCDQMVHRP